MKKIFFPLCLIFISLGGFSQNQINSVKDLVEAMYSTHKGKWHETLTFVQQTIRYNKAGEADTSIWYEALAPGKLRIDFAPVEAGNGMLAIGDTRYDFKNGKLVNTEKDYNPFMLLLSDVYFLQPERSLQLIDSLGYDLNLLSKNGWEGRDVYVTGALRGDTLKNQFWIDSEHLYPVRIINMVGPENKLVLDSHIGGYKKMGETWVESTIRIYINGRLLQDEYYTQIKVNPVLNEKIFDPENWNTKEKYWE